MKKQPHKSRQEAAFADNYEEVLEMLRGWNCLKEIGFGFERSDVVDLGSGNFVTSYVFTNEKADRWIKFKQLNDEKGIFAVTIGRKHPTKRLFPLADWLIDHKDELEPELSRGRYDEVTLSRTEDALEQTLQYLEQLFMGPLKPILMGETWENVPFNPEYK